jgi:RNA polymerase sigma-70 factor (ECF subfamily)
MPRRQAGADQGRDGFEQLYRDTYPRVRFALLAMLRDPAAADDCTQEAFARAFRAWDTWKRDAPAEAWIHRIAINVAISHRRRERLREVGETVRRLGRPAPHTSPDIGITLLDALRRIPPREAAVIVLRHHHGYTNREIAAALRLPESTVASRLAAAKRRLQAILGQEAEATMADAVTPEVSRVL